jgi:hypothetical protein
MLTKIQLNASPDSGSREEGGWHSWRHAANSAGIPNFRQSWMDGAPWLRIFGQSAPPQRILNSPVLLHSVDALRKIQGLFLDMELFHRQPG